MRAPLRPVAPGRRADPEPHGPGPEGRSSTYHQGVPETSIRARLAMPFDPPTLRRIKRLWVRHSIAEERRDVDGLVATLAPDCVYEIVPTGQRWDGHGGARRFYAELFGAFPDNVFALTDIVVGPQGVFEVATLTGTNTGPWAGSSPSGLPVRLRIIIHFPWDESTGLFGGERIYFDRAELGLD